MDQRTGYYTIIHLSSILNKNLVGCGSKDGLLYYDIHPSSILNKNQVGCGSKDGLLYYDIHLSSILNKNLVDSRSKESGRRNFSKKNFISLTQKIPK